MMKVTVTFGQTGVVVPCKDGWTVRDLIQQATQRYRKLLEQGGDFLVRTHHVEYCDGGILDPDDILSDLVEDKDKEQVIFPAPVDWLPYLQPVDVFVVFRDQS
ncbi:Partitioning defective 3 -like protein B [Collichthys lucidus]|uniref:Partitioning defective 3-like protein B n=1 Tax=Collichthys lucidus TaxID=240159 RepID=A0A4U5U0F2_COLLU|nr:Partitioning defective 3 -like protein B [Collichthys lucidus]